MSDQGPFPLSITCTDQCEGHGSGPSNPKITGVLDFLKQLDQSYTMRIID